MLRLTTKGRIEETGEVRALRGALRSVVWWGEGVMGVAEATFPHPKEWRLDGVDARLDEVTVKLMTRALNDQSRVAPSCLAAWEARIGRLPADVGARYNLRLLTPKDWSSHFKNVLHRALWTKSRRPGDAMCRCCGEARESIEHFSVCRVVGGGVFRELRSLAGIDESGDKEKQRYDLFTVRSDGRRAEEGWVNLNLLVWKQLVATLVRMETEGEAFARANVWSCERGAVNGTASRANWCRARRNSIAYWPAPPPVSHIYFELSLYPAPPSAATPAWSTGFVIIGPCGRISMR